MYRTFADVVTKNELDEQAKQAGLRPLTPPVTGGKPYNDVAERSPDQAEYMNSIIHRMENLPPDPRRDNPLKITNDARKAGLDFRLILPEAEDFAGSKINAAVERIHRIWQDTAADRGTQLVFCDLSTPKSGKALPADASPQPDTEFETLLDVDGTLIPEGQELAARGTDIIEEGDENGEDATVASDMDAVIALSSRFSVYDDIRNKLVARGIPAEEIAFIHEANTDVRKAKLFSDMNTGHVRILLGSTSKMGAGMNVQKRLVAAHHLDAPWRPSDLEQRNGRIIRQGNLFYERDPDNFSVGIYNYATKQTYDARMWQTIEYKAAAIEQFRKGDLLQRVIDDVQSEAANAAEMKAAASGNPLILMQVQLAADLRKLEALYSQHQRGQHRMRDRLKWLEGTDARLAEAEADHAANLRCRDANTRIVREKDKEKIRIELRTDEGLLTDKDGEKMKDLLLGCVKEVTRNVGAKALFGTYRGFVMHVVRHTQSFSGKDGFRITVSGPGEREFRPDNLVYTFDDKLSLSGLFQRMDNFLGKGLEEGMEKFREKCRQEKAELATVQDALGREFPQKAELALARENNSAVIRELQRMQDDASYVSAWTPKTSLADDQPAATEAPQQTGTDNIDAPPAESPEKQFHTLKYGEGEGRSEYTISNQHNGHTLENGYILRRTYFNSAVGSLGQSLYDDGLWHSTATVPRDVKLRLFASLEEGLIAAREDAARRGLKEEAPTVRETAADSAENHNATQSYHDRLANAGFSASSSDFYGKHEHALTLDANDGGTYELRVFKTVGDRIGLRVQYEKNRIIDGTHTVNAIFDTLAEALEHVEAYRQLTAPQAKAAVQTASPLGGVSGFVISSPRMR